MAFVKDPLNATTPREIIEYSQDLEDRIEVGFEDVADYVIEQGSDYRKWGSGILEQWGSYNYQGGVTTATAGLYASDYFTIPFGQSFIGSPSTVIATLRRVDRYGFVSLRVYGGTGATCAILLTSTYGVNYPLYVEWYATGRWK